MCVGRYAAKDMRNERSEMEHNRSEMPANIRITNTHPSGMRFRYQWAIWCCRIPLECIILVYLLQAFRKFRWNASSWYIYCRHFEKIPFRFAPLHLFCIPAYTHQIPTGFFQSSLNIHRENLYIMTKNISPASLLRKGRTDYIINAGWRLRLKHAECLSLRYDGNLLLCRLLR